MCEGLGEDGETCEMGRELTPGVVTTEAEELQSEAEETGGAGTPAAGVEAGGEGGDEVSRAEEA